MITTPAQFRSAHSDVTAWSTFDFEVYERLVEAASASVPLTVHPDLTGLSSAGLAALNRLTTTVAYWLAERTDAEQAAYDIAIGSAA